MSAMSAETRSMVAATMFVALGEMKAHMDVLQQIVENEVRRQFDLQTLDLRTLYSSLRRREENFRVPERKLAVALGLWDVADTNLGEDEIF
jgi:transaldolase